MEDPTTVVIYHMDEEETPYKAKLKVSTDDVTLNDFKSVLNLPRNYKFFFKSEDADFGVVKEEISDDRCKLPVLNGRVEAWLVSADGSAHSDTKSPPWNGESFGPPSHSRLDGKNPPPYNMQHFDQTACTSETESTVSGLPKFPRRNGKLDRRMYCTQYYDKSRMPPKNRNIPGDSSSVVTSDLDTTSFLDSEDDQGTRISNSTDITSVSRQHLKQRKKKRIRLPRTAASKVSSVSSITESSLSLNIITVVLNVETGGFLGISIVGQSDQCNGDGGIYVGSIMNGGAVGLDGRIQRGDMILQVNDIPFDGMSNDEAVRVLKEVVKKQGPVRLVVAKCWDANASRNDFSLRRTEPVRPIDPGAWVAHTNALMNEIPLDYPRTMSPSRASPNNSGSFTSPVPPTDLDKEIKLDLNLHDIQTIVRAVSRPDSGLEVKNRKWLKINIPDAFLGSDLVDWLQNHVHGFVDRKGARKFASTMLKENYIKHTVNKITFSDQCYYVFGDLCGAFSTMGIDAPREEGAQSDHDTVAPLPPPPSISAQSPPWASVASTAPYAEPLYAPTVSMVSGYAPMQFQTTDVGMTPPTVASQSSMVQGPAGRSDVNSSASGTSGNSSGSERKSIKKLSNTIVATSPLAK